MKKVVVFLLVLVLACITVVTASANEDYGINEPEVNTEFDKYMAALIDRKYSSDFSKEGYYYRFVYSYPSNDEQNAATSDEYAMFIFSSKIIMPMNVIKHIGEYVIYCGYYTPYELGYFVYVPQRDTVYTLEEAYRENISGIDKAFIEGCYSASLGGDANVDGELNVKDATLIQKQIAELLPAYPFDYINKLGSGSSDLYFAVKDFNRDKAVNIKDATAIQKHIAGLEY